MIVTILIKVLKTRKIECYFQKQKKCASFLPIYQRNCRNSICKNQIEPYQKGKADCLIAGEKRTKKERSEEKATGTEKKHEKKERESV